MKRQINLFYSQKLYSALDVTILCTITQPVVFGRYIITMGKPMKLPKKMGIASQQKKTFSLSFYENFVIPSFYQQPQWRNRLARGSYNQVVLS